MINKILIFVTIYLLWITFIGKVYADSKEHQYCNIETSTVKTFDKEGNFIERNKETVVCNDGVKHILHDAGIAKECRFYTWTGYEGYTEYKHRALACKKLDGGYEIIPNYSGID